MFHVCGANRFDARSIWAIMPPMFTRLNQTSGARQKVRHSLLILRLMLLGLLFVATACESLPVVLPSPVVPTPTLPAPTATATVPSSATLVAFPTVMPSPTKMPLTPGPDQAARLSAIAPVVQLVSPLNNAQLSINQTFYVFIYAADDQGIARLELWVDGMLVRSETPTNPSPVFSVIVPWTPTQPGAYVVRAVAYDATNRASVADEATVNVVTDARKPSAMIVYPIGTPQVELGELVNISAVATDEATIVQLELWVDNQLYTYVTPQNSASSQLATLFAWYALAPGTHTLFVRARDTQDQTTDSAPLRIFVASSRAPSVQASFERTNTLAGEPITVTITALDAAGIQRIELLNGKDVVASIPSGNPGKQTVLTSQVVWQSANPGDYSLMARAVNANNAVKESPAQMISVLRPGQATPTSLAPPTPTRTRTPRPTATARPQPPGPPSAELIQPTTNFNSPMPLRVTFNGKANSELDRIELWGYALGQPNPQMICSLDARATTNKTAQCDWMPPSVGVWTVYAQAIDIYRQVGKSAPISGFIGAPALPLPSPTPITFSGRWSATTSSGQFSAVLRQSGTAIRGEFKLVAPGTPDQDGRITSGTLRADRMTFHVDFTPAATAVPSATITTTTTMAPTVTAMDFDCGVDANATTLTCTFKDSRGRGGNANFRRE